MSRYEAPTERSENHLKLLYIKLFFSLFVLQMGTLKLRLFLKFTSHELKSGRRLYNLRLVFLLISSNRLDVRDSLRSNEVTRF